MTDWTNLKILDVLDRVERHGQTLLAVALVYGTSRGAIQGVVHRIRQALDIEDRRPNRPGNLDLRGCPAVRAENKDGGMPARWWDRASPPEQVRRGTIDFRKKGCGK